MNFKKPYRFLRSFSGVHSVAQAIYHHGHATVAVDAPGNAVSANRFTGIRHC